MLLPFKYSFRLVSKKTLQSEFSEASETSKLSEKNLAPVVTLEDDRKRSFLKLAGLAGVGIVASQLLPKKADAYVLGSTPSSSVVGLKNAANTRINPATDESLTTLIAGQGVTKLTTNIVASGSTSAIVAPTSGGTLHIYAIRFSLTANMTSVSFRFTSGGTDREIYLAPVTGGLYGSNNHPNYVAGAANQALYCVVTGASGAVQVNVDYLEV